MQVGFSKIDISMSSTSINYLKQSPTDQASIWKPLKGPVQDWPLTLCDTSSVEKEDLVPCDIVSSAEVTENMILRFNHGQRWHYLSNQLPSELLVFRQMDSLGATKPRELDNPQHTSFELIANLLQAVPHMSFSNPLLQDKEAFCRESIEVRAVIYFSNQVETSC